MTVSSQTSRVSYAGNGSTTAFAVSFYFLADSHLKVILRAADGSETVKTLTTDYTVSGAGNPSGGAVTMNVAPTSGATLVIVRNVPLTQETDYQANDPFPAESHERALDKLTMENQGQQLQIDRALKVTETDPTSVSTDLPSSIDRAGTVLAFDETGAPVAGPDVASVGTVLANIENINIVAGIDAEVTTVAGVASDVTTVAGIAADVSAVAGIAADVTTVAENIADINTVADNIADVTNFADVYLGAKTGDPSTRNDGSPLQNGDLYFNTASNQMRVYGGGTWSPVTAQAITITQNAFTGNGSTTTFTLSEAPVSKNNIIVEVGGVIQTTDSYSVSGTTLTFSAAPANGVAIETRIIATNNNLNSAQADAVTFNQAGSGAVTRDVQSKLRDFVSVKDYGASSSNTAAQNLAAFKLAVSATATGGKLMIPVDSSYYTIDATGGLSNAIVIDRRMEIVFEGDVKSNYGVMQANPPYLFKITAAGVTFSGSGKIIGDGTKDDTNAGTDTTFPGLVYVNADNFIMRGVIIDTPPKVGVMIYNCYNAKIIGNTFTGGPTVSTFGNTAYFGVRLYLGGNHLISENNFFPDASGGMYVNCIFGSGASNSTVSNNVAVKPYEKLVYFYGDKNFITGNVVKGNENTIPGTSQSGTLTSVYRVNGSYNKITNNYSDFCLGGATAMDGIFNEISNNTFVRCGQGGIAVFGSASYAGGFVGTIVDGNICTATTMTGVSIQDGILVYVDGSESTNISVSSNKVYGFADSAGEAQIKVMAQSPYAIRYSLIRGNFVNGGANGIIASRVASSLISENYVDTASAQGFTETGGAYNQWANNRCRNAQTGISGLSSTSYGTGNQYTNASLTGQFTCAAASSTTVTHGGVAANARIFLQTANDAAGIMIVSKGWPTSSVSGNNFSVQMANGTAAGGTEQFHYNIIQ